MSDVQHAAAVTHKTKPWWFLLKKKEPFQGFMARELIAGLCTCAGNCSTYHCYKGGPEEPPLGQETGGCPLYSHPAQLTDNRNCVLCMVCDKVRVPGYVQIIFVTMLCPALTSLLNGMFLGDACVLKDGLSLDCSEVHALMHRPVTESFLV